MTDHSTNSKFARKTQISKRRSSLRSVLGCTLLVVLTAAALGETLVQGPLPFEVANPKNKKWSAIEAGRIYASACNLVARSIRPERPPTLQPRFRLVLGAEADEFVRDQSVTEIHLKAWNPERFAQGVVALAMREALQEDEMQRIARISVALANSTLDARDPRMR